MGLINSVAQYIINNLGGTEYDYDVCLYVISQWLHTFVSMFFVILISLFLGVTKWALLISFVGFVLRSFSGGAHSKSPIVCSVVSVALINGFALIVEYVNINSNYLMLFSTLVFLLGFYLIYKYAPADTPQKPIISTEFKKQLRMKSYIFLCVALIIVLIPTVSIQIKLSILLSVSWQLLTITPVGYAFLHGIDKSLKVR